MCKILTSERQCHSASYCCTPRCAYLSSELNICRCFQVCTLSHPSLPNLCKVPRRQSYRIQSPFASGIQHLGLPCRQTGRGLGTDNCPKTSELNPGCQYPDQLCRVDSTIIPLWGVPREVRQQDLHLGLCLLVSPLIILN